MIASVFHHFLDLWSLLSTPAHVPFYSPGSQDSIEWWTMSVGGGRPNLWLFLLDKVRYWKLEKCWNILEFGQHEMSRMFINPFFALKMNSCLNIHCSSTSGEIMIWKRLIYSSLSKNLLPRKFSGFFETLIWAKYFCFSIFSLIL